MSTCLASHSRCNTRRLAHRDFMPTRVLDLGGPANMAEPSSWNTDPGPPPSSIRLVETASPPRIQAPYATLSHCWGPDDKKFARLEKGNREDLLRDGIRWEELCRNRNFEHAVLVARRLRVRYLWIDSLCIIQGPGGQHDWDAEAPLMHHVYRNAQFNIAASHARDRDGGLFYDRKHGENSPEIPRYTPSDQYNGTMFGSNSWRLVHKDFWQDNLLKSWLYTRGWVFQERMLSSRILHFTATQIFWDCATLSACESMPDGLPPPLDHARAAPDRHWRERLQQSALSIAPLAGPADGSLDAFWRGAVRAYTACNLTRPDDRATAIWGVAKLLRDALAEDCCGEGLFFSGGHLAEQLAWRVVDCGDPRTRKRNETFPSWCWISVNGAVEVADRWPSLERFYLANGHGGGKLALDLDAVLFPDRSSSQEDRGKQMLELQTSDTSAMNPQKNQLAPSSPHTRPPKRLWRPNLDTPSHLKSHLLDVRCHIGRGILCRGIDTTMPWRVLLTGDGECKASVSAFPDSEPASESSEIVFLVLAASRVLDEDEDEDVGLLGGASIDCEDDSIVGDEEYASEEEVMYESGGESGFGDEPEHEDENPSIAADTEPEMDDPRVIKDGARYLYDGIGLLVEPAAQSERYRRVGAITFRDVPSAGWRAIRIACGDTENLDTKEMNPSNGKEIHLE